MAVPVVFAAEGGEVKRRQMLRGFIAAAAVALVPIAFNQARIQLPRPREGLYYATIKANEILSTPIESITRVWLNGEELTQVANDAEGVTFARPRDGRIICRLRT